MNTTLARTTGHPDRPLARAVAADQQMLNLTLAETLQLGAVLAKSGYFKDVRDEAQAVVKILYGRELGIGPASSLMAIHVIEGKPSPSAALMATLIKKSRRYNYRVTVWTDKECRITFFERGEPCGEASFTWAEAVAAKVAGKDVWLKYPKAMLFSRAMGQGARAFCADVFGGAAVYAAEELGGDTVAEDTALEQHADPATGEIVEGHAVEVPPEPAPAPVVPAARRDKDVPIDPLPCTDAQVQAIVTGFNTLGFDEATRAAWLKPYHVTAVHQLSGAGAEQLRRTLQDEFRARRLAGQTAGVTP